MVKSSNISLLILLFLTFHLTAFAQKEASVIKKLSKGADVILTGKIIKKESSWNAARTKIYTKSTLQVDEHLKGDDKSTSVEIIHWGGEVDGVGELYSHMPKFEENEEVLVFLKKDDMNHGYKVLNGEEGKLTIIRDAKTNEEMTSSHMLIKSLKSQIKGFITK